MVVDAEALEGALRSLGLLYGTRLPADVLQDGLDQAIRGYILRERAHLLAAYELEALVAMVRAAVAGRDESGPVVEQFGPLR
jgi:hypothetical protein